MRVRLAPILLALGVAIALAAVALLLPGLRHTWIDAITGDDAVPSAPAALPGGAPAPGLPRVARTRVLLIDGLGAETARTLPAWTALCERGARLVVDVGFPTVSLPVEVALWSGLTQQQTGIVGHGDVALAPPLDRRGIPAQVAGSWAVAENHGYLVRSLGFARTDTELTPDGAPDTSWTRRFEARATDAVTSDAPLAFVHVLRVDSAGHHHGAASPEYASAAHEADAILARLVAAAPSDARWFVLSDHGHLPGGGHGGEERAVRQVEGCVAGPGIAHLSGGPVHVIDIARAIADSTGAHLSSESLARPWSLALAAPLDGDQAVPSLALTSGAIAALLIAAGLAASAFGVRRWWLAPWWFVVACGALLAVRGEPTLSMPMTYAHAGRAMYLTWLPALAIAAVSAHLGMQRTTLARAVIAQLALPVAVLAGAITASGGWATLLGEDIAPVVPRFTAWVSPLILMLAHGSAAVALAALATAVRRAFDRPAPPAPPRSAPSAAP